MHRSICRVFGRTCRKWRENEYSAVSGEEARNNGGQKNKEGFIPDTKYTLCDAVGWAAGLAVAYEFTHGRLKTSIEERPTTIGFNQFKNTCPFGWPRTVASQPILSSVFEIKGLPASSTRVSHGPTSIDLTPFIKEDGLLESVFDNVSHKQDEEDELIQFGYDLRRRTAYKQISSLPLKSSTALTTKLIDVEDELDLSKSSITEKLTGDLLSVLGVFKFLNYEAKGMKGNKAATWRDRVNNITPEEPPLSALELMEEGADLGSSRALYNIGVAYDRMKEYQLAREYYSKAADLGHPLATYNYAVFLLRDGKIGDGLSMMQVAASKGVPEAHKIISSSTAI